MVKYKTEESRYSVRAHIEEVEVIKETPGFVTFTVKSFQWDGPDKLVERREAKVTEYHRYHDTWEAAHAHLMAEAEKQVVAARLALERVKGAQGNVKGMKPPQK